MRLCVSLSGKITFCPFTPLVSFPSFFLLERSPLSLSPRSVQRFSSSFLVTGSFSLSGARQAFPFVVWLFPLYLYFFLPPSTATEENRVEC